MSARTSPSRDRDSGVHAKRRLRKGTTSCRECKRRKTRCFFASAKDAICVGCQRRGTTCLTQDVDDDPALAEEDLSMRARLIRVESLLGQLMEKVQIDGEDSDEEDHPGGGPSVERNQSPWQTMPMFTPESIDPPQLQESDSVAIVKGNEKYSRICAVLRSALPSQQVANVLFSASKVYVYFQVLCNSYNTIRDGNEQPASLISAYPPINSHPILFARKLLQLAVCIQQMDPTFDESVLHLSEPLEHLMVKYVDLATTLVTTDDKLLDSREGIECLLIEGIYLINSGHLRRAWMTFRRAVSLCQFMGIHHGNPRTIKILDPRIRVSCPVLWYRIAYGERYLSLMIGVPTGISECNFTLEETMIGDTEVERLDRAHAFLFGRVLQRNEMKDAEREFATTQEIDYDLQKAAKNMGTRWWIMPDYNQPLDYVALMTNLLKSQTQIIHFNLLTIVHLPFMLRNSAERRYDYSKLTCVYASREVLSRWISFRSFMKIVYCCRFVDFCAFTAALTLLLGYLDSHTNSLGDLSHQRCSDRGLIEKALEILEELNNVNGDALSKKTAEVTQRLLDWELEAADSNTKYSTRTPNEDEGDDEDRDQSFRLPIPYFGTVVIARDSMGVQPVLTSETATTVSTPYTQNSFAAGQMILPSHPVPAVAPVPVSSWEAGSQQIAIADQMQGVARTYVSLEEHLQSQMMEMPAFLSDAEEWAFQGVDSALFDAVLKGDAANQVSWDGSGNWSSTWDGMA